MSQAYTYTYTASGDASSPALLQRSDGALVPCDLGNMDYQVFLKAIAAGMAAPAGWTGPTNPT